MANLQTVFRDKLAAELKTTLGVGTMEVPRITKITLNMGVGEATADRKILEKAVEEMTAIAGQKPVITKTRIAIAAFKVRENYPVGVKVTLRREKMYEFLERLIAVALPRIRDFRGIRSEEHTSELQSLMRISYAVFCLQKKKHDIHIYHHSIML